MLVSGTKRNVEHVRTARTLTCFPTKTFFSLSVHRKLLHATGPQRSVLDVPRFFLPHLEKTMHLCSAGVLVTLVAFKTDLMISSSGLWNTFVGTRWRFGRDAPPSSDGVEGSACAWAGFLPLGVFAVEAGAESFVSCGI